MSISLYIFILFQALTYSQVQDSLVNFKIDSLNEPISKTLLTVNKILFGNHIPFIKALRHKNLNNDNQGYRIQLFETTSSSIANEKMIDFKSKLEGAFYFEYEVPLYKVRYGDFPSKNDAKKKMDYIHSLGFKDIWLVRSKIKYGSK